MQQDEIIYQLNLLVHLLFLTEVKITTKVCNFEFYGKKPRFWRNKLVSRFWQESYPMDLFVYCF